MPRGAAMQEQLSRHLATIANARQRILENTDPEGLHDLRVAIRGLRAILPLLGKPLLDLRTQWRALAQATSACRDLEVLLELFSCFPDAPDAVRIRLSAEEGAARQALCQILASAEVPLLLQLSRRKLTRHLAHLRSRTLSQRAEHRAAKLAQSIQRQILELGGETSACDWHALRLTIKRLRYLIEHGGGWLPKHWCSLHPVLKQIQIALGELHDMDMWVARTGLDDSVRHDALRTAASDAVASLTGVMGDAKMSNLIRREAA